MNQSLTIPDLTNSCVAIVGIGLMGGSLAAALQKRKCAKSVIGVGRNQQRLDQAVKQGLLDQATTNLKSAAEKADLIVVCTPVNRIVTDVRNIASHVPIKPTRTLITDVGSTKKILCESLNQNIPAHVEFVGSHPIAGSEKTGFENADSDLFVDHMVVITPMKNNSAEAIQWIDHLWESVEAKRVQISPTQHDEILARTSHVPHIVAAALASTLKPSDIPFTASGFQDTTRVAAGDPQMWNAILEANKEHLIPILKQLESILANYREAIENENQTKILELLTAAKKIRDQV